MKTDRPQGRQCAASKRSNSLTDVARQMRQATLATLNGVIHDAQLAGEEAQKARSAGELAALQLQWAAQQWSRGQHVAADLLRGWLEAQAVWWHGVEKAVDASLQPWLAVTPATAPPRDTDAAWPTSLAELALRSGEVRDAVARAWMSALVHDLRPAGAST